MDKHRATLFSILILAGTGLATAAETPVSVSPGEETNVGLVEARCPAFSWGGVADARSHELIVYRVGPENRRTSPVLRRAFPSSVQSWTPSLDQCLDRGERYAWSVRALVGEEPSEWSSPRLFEVAAATSEQELEQALETVRQYLQEREESLPNRGASHSLPGSGLGRTGVAPDAVEQAPQGTTVDFSVDSSGGVVATSYSAAGDFVYSPSKATSLFLAPKDFVPGFFKQAGIQMPNAEWAFGYLHITDGTSQYFEGDLKIPDGAVIQSVECLLYDNDATANLIAGGLSRFIIRRREYSSTATTEVVNLVLATSGASTVFWTPSTSSISTPTVDLSTYDYHVALQLTFNTAPASYYDLRFYGCHIAYLASKLSP